MTKDKALQLALDALEGFIPYLPLRDETQCNHYDKAITALRLTIDAQNMASKSTYKEQLETKDEPVAYINVEERKLEWANKFINWKTPTVFNLPKIPLYTTPQSETKDEPVGWIDSKGYMICVKTDESCRPLYTTPQRTWVGLTVDEIAELVCNLEDPENRIELGKKIEAKLKDKNT
jgi:hypothetical protein